MSAVDVPAAIRTVTEATNRGDSEVFATAFTQDARLDDWRRTFHGHDGVPDTDGAGAIAAVSAHKYLIRPNIKGRRPRYA
ncbi:hypothetical protein [Streptomyces sp. AHA2]|uniref:hypothetical protein n=1 Tax=Streptomyces sp. AHA2 TaxID=3064526 RepID=UPI002FE3E324